MSATKTLGAVLGGVALIIAVILVVVAFSSIIGGLAGAGIAMGYNVILGTTFSIEKFALIGSIVGLLASGSSAASNGT